MQESINVDSFGSDYFHAASGDKTACSLHLDSAKREEARRVFPPFHFQQSLTLALCARFTVILTWGQGLLGSARPAAANLSSRLPRACPACMGVLGVHVWDSGQEGGRARLCFIGILREKN